MPKGTLDRSSTELSEALKDHMQALFSEALPIRTVGDQSMFDLIEEWDSLCRERHSATQSLIDNEVGSPLEICAFALELGVYPPPWAIQALVETIQDYLLMTTHLRLEDDTDKPVDPSQITRLESFLVDDVPNGKTVIGYLRSSDHDHAQFCSFSSLGLAALASEVPSKQTLKSLIIGYLSKFNRSDDPDSFERALRLWAERSESNKQKFDRLQSLLAEKSRGKFPF